MYEINQTIFFLFVKTLKHTHNKIRSAWQIPLGEQEISRRKTRAHVLCLPTTQKMASFLHDAIHEMIRSHQDWPRSIKKIVTSFSPPTQFVHKKNLRHEQIIGHIWVNVVWLYKSFGTVKSSHSTSPSFTFIFPSFSIRYKIACIHLRMSWACSYCANDLSTIDFI